MKTCFLVFFLFSVVLVKARLLLTMLAYHGRFLANTGNSILSHFSPIQLTRWSDMPRPYHVKLNDFIKTINSSPLHSNSWATDTLFSSPKG